MKTTKVPKIMLYSSAPKRAADSRISETTTHNSSSPAFKRRSKLPILKVLLLDAAAAVGTTLVGAAAVEDGTAAAVEDGTAAAVEDGTAATVEDGTAAAVEDGTAATVEDGTAAAVEDGTADAGTTLVDATLCTTKRKRDDDPVEGMFESMKKLKTDDEGTKRFLLGLHYMNTNAPTREITFQATTGDIIFGKYL
jgi:hypothetical protein